jgi:4-hydroxybenzoate polyprenyltransferase
VSGPDEQPRAGWREGVAALRPSQWTKNGLVFAALFFALWDQERTAPLGAAAWWRVALAAVAFSLASSAVYVMNDLWDREADRHHPTKRFRPIAAGRIAPRTAGVLAIALAVAAGVLAGCLSPALLALIGFYGLLQAVYTFRLKRVPFIDVLLIASGFVLRAIAGGLAIDVRLSAWLLLCTFLLALFLALCKRRHEKVVLAAVSDSSRPALRAYDARLLDQCIVIAATSTIVTYAIYTLWPATVAKFETEALGFTIPFVVFGIFRYLDLVYRHEQGERPERVLLTDGPLLCTIALYGLTAAALLLWRSGPV